MTTEREIYESYLGPDLAHHCAVCRGEYCAVCDSFLPTPPWTRGLRLCRNCWPNPAEPFHALHISLMWDKREGWSLCFSNCSIFDTGAKVSHWLLLHDRAEAVAILDRYLCVRKSRAEFDKLSDHAGHITIGIFVTDRRLAALAEATRRDSRSAYEKRSRRVASVRHAKR